MVIKTFHKKERVASANSIDNSVSLGSESLTWKCLKNMSVCCPSSEVVVCSLLCRWSPRSTTCWTRCPSTCTATASTGTPRTTSRSLTMPTLGRSHPPVKFRWVSQKDWCYDFCMKYWWPYPNNLKLMRNSTLTFLWLEQENNAYTIVEDLWHCQQLPIT